MINIGDLTWYAMRASYCREMKTKEYLKTLSIECFVPIKYQMSKNDKNKKFELVPAISNLIFVHSTESTIKEIRRQIPFLKHILDVIDNKHIPLIVPDFQMERFITVVNTSYEQITYLDPEQIDLTKGDRVVVTDGAFEGQEGTLVKIKGKRSKQLVVIIDGIVA